MSTALVRCSRCGGKGWIPRFGHNLKGLCFQCNGAGEVRGRVHAATGTIDHDHRIAYLAEERCVLCGLPVAEWPPVVVAKWWGDQYQVFLGNGRTELIPADSRRRGQGAVRAFVSEAIPTARIKWTAA